MSDSEEKQLPSNSSDISIEEIGPENEGQVAKNGDAEDLINEVLDDVSVGGRIEELSGEEVNKDGDIIVEPEIPPPVAAVKVDARRSMLEDSDEEDESEEEEEVPLLTRFRTSLCGRVAKLFEGRIHRQCTLKPPSKI